MYDSARRLHELCILLDKSREVRESRMIRLQEVKLTFWRLDRIHRVSEPFCQLLQEVLAIQGDVLCRLLDDGVIDVANLGPAELELVWKRLLDNLIFFFEELGLEVGLVQHWLSLLLCNLRLVIVIFLLFIKVRSVDVFLVGKECILWVLRHVLSHHAEELGR